MAVTYEPIATYTVPSAQANYTFSAISGTYTDLVLIASIQATSTTDAIYINFNGDTTSSNYGFTRLTGISTTPGTTGGALPQIADYCPNATNFMPIIANIQNYSNATTWKSVVARWGNAGDATGINALVWGNTAAITSITIRPASATDIKTGSTFTLYGIKAA
jgi:hypothetical protein